MRLLVDTSTLPVICLFPSTSNTLAAGFPSSGLNYPESMAAREPGSSVSIALSGDWEFMSLDAGTGGDRATFFISFYNFLLCSFVFLTSSSASGTAIWPWAFRRRSKLAASLRTSLLALLPNLEVSSPRCSFLMMIFFYSWECRSISIYSSYLYLFIKTSGGGDTADLCVW